MLENYEPKEVFRFFEQITQIPHGSGNTQAISDYLVDFAVKRNLLYQQDSMGNVIIWKDATAGYEKEKPVMLQGHMDMVAVKELECPLDLKKDSLQLEVEGDYLYAKGTSLGGDDGIALAYALAILDSESIPHPPLEAVFTVEEEIGMEGAAGIDLSKCRAKTLINLDSEEEGELIVSCAGGVRVHGKIQTSFKACTGSQYQLVLEGLCGGHSGTEIHKGRGNAILLLGKVLQNLMEQFPLELCSMAGGTADNAIPADAWAQIAFEKQEYPQAEQLVKMWDVKLKEAWQETDPGICLTIKKAEQISKTALEKEIVEQLLYVLCNCPNGVIRMCDQLPDLVETSLNLGLLKTQKQYITLDFSLRSSVEWEREKLSRDLCEVLEKAGIIYEETGAYPAWEYKETSPLREKMCGVYRDLYQESPKLVSIHAGLECGMLARKIPGLDCISCGPNMLDIHTTKEKLSISSTKRVWDFLLEVLRVRRNIILIGMPGAGKSTVGVVLAKNLGFRFVDSDLVIQEQAQKKLHELISQLGVEGFWEYENQVNASIWADKTVIATGGSAVYGREAMEHFQRMGTVVYLKLPYEEIQERLGDLTQRGVTVQAGQTLEELYAERIPLYEQYGTITVDCAGKSIREIVLEISEQFLKEK